MKVAIVAESFLPEMNGVTHSLLKILQFLASRGDEVLVIAPSTPEDAPGTVEGAAVHRLPAIPVTGYRTIRVAVGGVARVKALLADFGPDVVHLASPFVLGWRAVRAAKQLGIPTVAVYQTDVPGYAAKYGMPFLENWAWSRVERIHMAATKTLAPSSDSVNQLRGHGIPRVELWRRGVDLERFHPGKRSPVFRSRLAPGGERIIGYVGRLALEKQLEDLAALAGIPNTRLVIVGDGPRRQALQELLPEAHFTGFLGGEELAAAVASFDLFVHPGELETFCQTIQEAMASGVPVVATGRGGPVDLVDSSRTGWLYQPGDLAQLRGYVTDLTGDDAKRAAFGAAALAQVQGRTWEAVCSRLVGLYGEAMAENRLQATALKGNK
ncbi:phosphatidylinositol alpha 1,6-mannosyltransferase [Arthrobacter silviterrae]|uniref:D-inositol 3-phosphate glycosyltransferase n=1 Tax=Arthrobacter silviterrae TaxID=2026658 RepID=A0ABX0D6F4_9MICC|nr:glycosyltransferase family 1 protein [Arthrobacter silviterrae]MDQ0276398.1 phosphatidylinositol alpha 1,6-mannosyltransferase [Arthrobacter silviterrae]NGN82422.1 glycosyltransferase family 1 protein [Arthrobacter silviterrae]